jgi:hypothetical protein
MKIIADERKRETKQDETKATLFLLVFALEQSRWRTVTRSWTGDRRWDMGHLIG